MGKSINIISQIGALVENILSVAPAKVNKKSKSFIIEMLILYCVMKKVNFTKLGLYGSRCEKTYRSYFTKVALDASTFNLALAKRYFKGSTGIKAIAIDPSYISKSGKHTPGLGYFWSGVAQKSKWGLEILGIGIVDTMRKTCIMLEGVPTPNADMIASEDVNKKPVKQELLVGSRAISDFDSVKEDLSQETVASQKRQYRKNADKEEFAKAVSTEGEEEKFNLIKWYLHAISCLPKEAFEYTNRVVADAYFSKRNFVDGLLEMGLHLVSRFRDDAALMYIYTGEQTGKRGRPQKYGGKVDYDNLDEKVFWKLDYDLDGGTCYAGHVYSKALKRNVKVVIWYSKDRTRRKIFFTTDFTLSYHGIVDVYRTRFQEEYCFRDTKDYLSLCKCQARNMRKSRLNYNMSFTALNCMKYVAWENGIDFSISNMKTIIHGEFLMNRFICVSGIKPDSNLITKLRHEVCSLTTMDWTKAA